MKEVLEGNWLRRWARPLRSSHPAIYGALNRLRQRALARGELVEAYQATAIRRFSRLVDLRGARILELGSDRDLRVLLALRRRGAQAAIGVNSASTMWGDASWAAPRAEGLPSGIELIAGDAASLPLDDSSVDHIFSVAVLEHLADLPVALAEMRRVLRPGGFAYASFGPLWSSGKGHHVLAEASGFVARHSEPENNPLPDFAHLLLDEPQMRQGLEGLVPTALIEPIVQFVHHSPYINRLMHHQYLAAFGTSPLELVSFEGQCDPVAPALQRILQMRWPGETRFDVTNAEVVLRRPSP